MKKKTVSTDRRDTRARRRRMRRARFKRIRQQQTPNALSLFRLCAGPVCYGLFTTHHWYLGALLFTLANITDFFDGYFARKYNAASKTGTYLDALADKVLVISTYAAFAQEGLIWWWVVAIILLRDVAVTWLRSWLLARGRQLTTSWFAKCKTVVQFSAAYIFIALALWPMPYGMIITTATSLVVAVLTVLSGLTYVKDI
ncbi:MAG: CDP-alcohol phosphatidyltransferase family protein [Candidatus Dependentiae bacterium]